MKKSSIILLFAIALAGCSDSSDNSTHKHHGDHHGNGEMDATMKSDMPKEQVQSLLTSYLKLKDALVAGNAEGASKAAKEMQEQLKEQNGKLEKGISMHASHIAATSEIGHQREHLSPLTATMYQLTKSAKIHEKTLYRQHCPMAFDNKGADWLSTDEEVNNPYFGDKMLHCGKTVEQY